MSKEEKIRLEQLAEKVNSLPVEMQNYIAGYADCLADMQQGGEPDEA